MFFKLLVSVIIWSSLVKKHVDLAKSNSLIRSFLRYEGEKPSHRETDARTQPDCLMPSAPFRAVWKNVTEK